MPAANRHHRVNLITTWSLFVLLLVIGSGGAAELTLDERAAEPGEWGYRPADESTTAVNPPSFSWRPMRSIVKWELECRRTEPGSSIVYRTTVEGMNVHCPPQVFTPGQYTWRYRGLQGEQATAWSQARQFTIPPDATQMPMPARDELLARIPQSHPRLFLRPEQLTRLRQLAQGPMRTEYQALVKQCEGLLKSPPPTAEPPKYPADIVRNSDPWREIWWGNRTYTTRALNGAATLAFTRLLGGQQEYGELAKRILMDCAKWDPKGATGYRYNDEAGMPYNYYFVRTYTFLYDQLSEAQRAECQRVMKIRGDEMYRHLYPNHLWKPYGSHSNRAWHFLGEVGVAMLGEVEGADDWVWFAMNVFYNTYPVWSDSDGGWHEGSAYWSSYINRFTWWADVMREAMGINAYDKPYFSKIGYYPMYLMPPGKVGGGFGDLNAGREAKDGRQLMSQLAVQAKNGHWQWYVDQFGGTNEENGYIGFIRGGLAPVAAQPPDDLPSSRLFAGVGQAFLNTTIRDADEDVQVVFKSSPFGTWSHGYESNNSFLLWAYGQRLLIRSGYRDSYGSDHHRNWMWSTRSVNNILVNGQGQRGHSQSAQGEIVAFHTSPTIDYVVGEAGGAYRSSDDGPSALSRFTRSILFVKPDLVVVYDRLAATEPSTFDYWLHAVKQFDVQSQAEIGLQVADVKCQIQLLAPAGLTFTQTDQYDPNPRPRIKLREWHLKASTDQQQRDTEFVAVYRPYRQGDPAPRAAQLQSQPQAYTLTAQVGQDVVTMQLPRTAAPPAENMRIVRASAAGEVLETLEVQ